MERSRQNVIDPMFAPRAAAQYAPAYTRRATRYHSSSSVWDVRLQAAAQTKTAGVSKPAFPAPARPPAPGLPRVQQAAARAAEPAADSGEIAAQEAAPPAPRKGWLRSLVPGRQTAVLYGMAGFVLAVGIVTSLGGLRANRQVAAQVRHGQQQTDASVADGVVPSTAKPSAAAVQHYAVSPGLPRYLDIPKLQVHTRVLSEGVTKSGQLQVPWNIYDTGWYNASSQPGQNGAMLVDGHSGIGNMHGIFYKLSTLAAGDPIIITRGDGKKFTYTVAKVQTVAVKNADMANMLVSANTARPGLNLITCAGERIPGTTELNKRVEVFAVLQ